MAEWSAWQAIEEDSSFSLAGLRETLEGGQAFRWQKLEESSWQGIWGDIICQAKLQNSALLARWQSRNEAGLKDIRTYFASNADWEALRDTLPWRSDKHLALCLQAQPSLRLLRQPFDEALLAFLCSALKRIPQIAIMCETVAERFGSEIAPGHHALPTWKRLSAVSEKELRDAGLGFRAKNIKKTADILATQPQLLSRIEALPYAEAKQELMQLPGVGEKIADCALLFGAGKLEAFPVDTWILKTMQKRYGLEDWNAAQTSTFGRIHFGQYAGYAQQFLFAWERQQS